MELYYEQSQVPCRDRVIALGTFDGLHLAHQQLFAMAQTAAKERGLDWGTLLFDKNPAELTGGDAEYLMTTEEKIQALSGCDFLYLQPFTKAFMSMSCEDFARFLTERLGAKLICTGYNYRFGYRAQGDTHLLAELGRKFGFEVSVLECLTLDGEPISSTAVRQYLRNGEPEQAARLLGREYAVTGTVEKGLQNGRKLGFPTANVSYPPKRVLPKSGVYAGFTRLDGTDYPSVINVGNNPTFQGKRITVESHILNFHEDIYDKIVTVSFAHHLRGEMRFESIDQLAAQITQDKQNAETLLVNRSNE